MHITPGEARDRSLELERVLSFSDGIFAIVITLLVLPITAEVGPLEGGRGLQGRSGDSGPRCSASS